MVEQLHDPYPGGDASAYTAGAPRRKPPGAVARLARGLARLVYPGLCVSCREAAAAPGGVCSACWDEVRLIERPACDRCGAPMDMGPMEGAICGDCLHAAPPWRRGAAAVIYGGAGRRLVLSLKHGDRLEVAPLAARWMLAAGDGGGAKLLAAADLVAPAPLHWRRLLKRRYNQSGELARALAKAAGRERALALDLLRRTRATPSQEGRNRLERRENVAGAFAVSPRWAKRVRGAKVLLIDDVLTTGATLAGCAETCLAAGAASVDILAFARATRDGRAE